MTNNENQRTSNEQPRHICMEVTEEAIRDFSLERAKVKMMKFGNGKVLVFPVPATEIVYFEYMRPFWREAKREQRHRDDISIDWLYEESNFEFADRLTNVEEMAMNLGLSRVVREALAELEERDRTITLMFAYGISEAEIGRTVGMSQRGVGKRKQRIFLKLRDRLKDYR